jgi:hypothetical protein
MKWTVRLIAELRPGELIEHDVATIEREALVSPATVGLSIVEAKVIMENLQKQMVEARSSITALASNLANDAAGCFGRRVIIGPLSAPFTETSACASVD